MGRKLRRIPQPPIDRKGRSDESRSIWWGVAILVAALATITMGVTLAQTFDDIADVREWRAIRSITTGDPRDIIATPGETDDERAASADGERTEPEADETPVADTPGTSDDFCPT